jgi:acyl dehydratase
MLAAETRSAAIRDRGRDHRFARQYDPQPFHVDKAAAEQSIYGG